MILINYIPDKCRRIAVVGMAKNAGKTVILNRLISEMTKEGITIGITSTGRDGEEQDLVTLTEKPRIYVPVGTLLATTEICLKNSDARVEVLETTGENTPMGQVVVIRVRQPGFIQIAGPDTNRGILMISKILEKHGASRVLVDGALDRKASASPAITDGCILATGAVLHRDPDVAVAMTRHQTEMFSLPVIENIYEVKRQWETLKTKGTVGAIDDEGELRVIPVTSAINNGRDLGNAMQEKDMCLLINGSLTGKTIKEITQVTSLYRKVPLVVSDATKIFMSENDWKIWKRMGVILKVINPVNLLMVTVNPISPEGYEFDKKTFREKMKNALEPIPVVDALEEGGLD
ncbi:MAG: hypothetical protein D5S00_11225 [Tindallia sp. MSAO_Bac2]|nr:MAG: hypothetical protein D5S00_11225 [Tindallia sp. MSAO_Bac2]